MTYLGLFVAMVIGSFAHFLWFEKRVAFTKSDMLFHTVVAQALAVLLCWFLVQGRGMVG